LSAATLGVEIDFIGDVYHLDHEGGFRNTTAEERRTEMVHFGRWWDIEFGLPARNRDDWGFYGLREDCLRNDARIVTLEAKTYAIGEEQNRADHEMMACLTRPAGSPDIAAAALFHTICAAHREKRRLICRIVDPQLAVTLSGFDVVASRFSVEMRCNWDWSSCTAAGYTIRPMAPEPGTLHYDDWIFEQRDCGFRIYEYGSEREIAVLPAVRPVDEPEFNPVLTRRLLRAYLHLQEQGARKIAIYGAGGHTKGLLQWGMPDNFHLAAIVDTPSLSKLESMNVDAVLLSSASFESDMAAECRNRGFSNVTALYNDWPRDMWRSGETPLLERRGGCAIDKKSRSHLSGADGVVARDGRFGVSHHPVPSISERVLLQEAQIGITV
jgi:hypothetical protein